MRKRCLICEKCFRNNISKPRYVKTIELKVEKLDKENSVLGDTIIIHEEETVYEFTCRDCGHKYTINYISARPHGTGDWDSGGGSSGGSSSFSGGGSSGGGGAGTKLVKSINN